jgi:cytochrome c oxidase assembly factor CtaG
MQNGWELSPLWILGLALIIVEEVGLARLMARTSAKRARAWRWRGVAYDLSIAVICIIDSSPLMGISMKHLTAHMLIHVVEMFYIPIVLVLSAPWLPALFALPVSSRRRVLRWWQLGKQRWLTRRLSMALTAPLFALVLFNATMLFWHIPRFFNWAMWNPWVHTWLMGPSFVLTGYLFWRVILASHPYGPRGSTRMQVVTIVVTAFAMLVIAMALSIFSHGAWFSMNIAMLGPTEAFRDQQFAAGILWICGDFWFVPALVVIVRRLIDESGGVEAAFEKALGRVTV